MQVNGKSTVQTSASTEASPDNGAAFSGDAKKPSLMKRVFGGKGTPARTSRAPAGPSMQSSLGHTSQRPMGAAISGRSAYASMNETAARSGDVGASVPQQAGMSAHAPVAGQAASTTPHAAPGTEDYGQQRITSGPFKGMTNADYDKMVDDPAYW